MDWFSTLCLCAGVFAAGVFLAALISLQRGRVRIWLPLQETEAEERQREFSEAARRDAIARRQAAKEQGNG